MATTGPVAGRIFSLDVIRGVAVMGIFSVNIIAFAMIEAAYLNPAAYGGNQGIDLLVWATNMLVIDGKMRTLFSMLFGASMLLVVDRADEAGQVGAEVHYRRMAVLLAIGLIHYFLIWHGDILTEYAVAGMFAFLARFHSVRALFITGCFLILVEMALLASVIADQSQIAHAAHAAGAHAEAITAWANGFGEFEPDGPAIAADRALHLQGYWPIAADKLSGWDDFLGKTMVGVPDTLGLMLLGMAGYKSGFLTGAWTDRNYRLVAATLIPIGMAAAAGVVAFDLSSGFDVVAMLAGLVVFLTPFNTLQAVGYAALIILLTRKQGWLSRQVAAAGRCAFTNYLGTSLIATFVFYGWGLGYYGSVSRAEAWLLVPFMWALILLWSKPWLDHFRYGPLEWVWRSLSRGSSQAMRKAATDSAA